MVGALERQSTRELLLVRTSACDSRRTRSIACFATPPTLGKSSHRLLACIRFPGGRGAPPGTRSRYCRAAATARCEDSDYFEGSNEAILRRSGPAILTRGARELSRVDT